LGTKKQKALKTPFILSLVIHFLLLCSVLQINGQDPSGNRAFLIKIDSTTNDISYYKYYSYLDTTPPVLEYEILLNDSSYVVNDTIFIGTEPTFQDIYFTNINIDTTGQIHIRKAITAREIARSLLNEKYGLCEMAHAGEIHVMYVDDKYWMIECNIWRNFMDGSIRIILSKYDGRIISWTNF
jgi:hypothetical protein